MSSSQPQVPVIESETVLIRMTVMQDDDGTCKVLQHDLALDKHRLVAKFPAEKKDVMVDGKPAKMDVAQVRAIVFAQTFEKLVNEGHITI